MSQLVSIYLGQEGGKKGSKTSTKLSESLNLFQLTVHHGFIKQQPSIILATKVYPLTDTACRKDAYNQRRYSVKPVEVKSHASTRVFQRVDALYDAGRLELLSYTCSCPQCKQQKIVNV